MTPADRPNRIPWPPLLFVLAVVAGYILNTILPLPWPSGRDALVLFYAGLFASGAGVLIDLWALSQFHRHQTTIFPHKAASTLIITGPYAWSRNPIYIAHAFVTIGVAALLSSLWIIVLLIPVLWAVDWLGVRREEAHLAAKFGLQWQDYAQRVRRWI